MSFSSQVQLATVSAYTLPGRIDFVLALGFLSAPARIFFAEDLRVFWSGQNVSTRPGGLVGGLSDFGAYEAWFAAYPRSCWAIRPPRSASCTSGWSCRSR
jgi:hypothetical protein